jgi:Fic family protein
MDWSQFDLEGAMRQRYLDIDDKINKVKELIRKAGFDFGQFQKMYDISWIYHENALEGVVLSFPEIRSAVEQKLVSDVSMLPTYKDIRAQKNAVDDMREKSQSKRFHVSIAFLKEMHGTLVRDPQDAGIYRKDIPIHRTYFHEIAAPAKIESQLQKVLDYLKDAKEAEIHPIEWASNVHHRFMRVFPFSTYSGFMGRLLLNFVLFRGHSWPVVIHSTDRQRYYEALRGSERDFRGFVADQMEDSLENAVRFLANPGAKRVAL